MCKKIKIDQSVDKVNSNHKVSVKNYGSKSHKMFIILNYFAKAVNFFKSLEWVMQNILEFLKDI